MIRHAIAILALTCIVTPVIAEDCSPLKLVASVDMEPLGKSSILTVQGSFNGTEKPLRLDTGTGISLMNESALASLGLHGIQNSKLTMLSSNGAASRSFVEVEDFRLGAVRVPRMQFQVAPNDHDADFVGSLGGDLLSVYDVEIDPAGHKLNFFTKDHCAGHVLYWHPTGLAVLPIQTQLATGDRSRTGYANYVFRDRRIFVPVTLDGKNFQALINTGSQASSMNAGIAKFQYGISYNSPGSTVTQASQDGDPSHATFTHVFPTLTFDGVTVSNARFVIYPDLTGARDPDNSSRTDTRIRRIDDNLYSGGGITIGMDILRRLRLFVAFSENKLYVTPATAPVTSVSTPGRLAPVSAAQ